MGVWGPGLFEDDLACEVRDVYRELIAEGTCAEHAKEAVLLQWQTLLADPEAGPVIWVSLAVTQWNEGRLDDETRNRALQLITDGSLLRAWEQDPAMRKRREAALLRVSSKLNAVQPKPKKRQKPFRDSCDWEAGELVSYKTLSGSLVVFRVIGIFRDQGGASPIVEVLDWHGSGALDVDELKRCGIRVGRNEIGDNVTKLMLGQARRGERPDVSPQQTSTTLAMGSLWRNLDDTLERLFGIR
jgi:hypothetical protein